MISDRICCLTALPMVFVALIGGLLMLSVHPIGAVLILLSAMSLLVRLAGGVCGLDQMSAENRTQYQGGPNLPNRQERNIFCMWWGVARFMGDGKRWIVRRLRLAAEIDNQ